MGGGLEYAIKLMPMKNLMSVILNRNARPFRLAFRVLIGC